MTEEKSMKGIEEYDDLIGGISKILEAGRHQAVWSLNTIMSAVYWEIGRRIVKFEQAGSSRAGYGEKVIERLSIDLKNRYGRGFGRTILFQIRAFYLAYRGKVQTVFGQSSVRKVQTPFGQLSADYFDVIRKALPLPWSQYFRLLSIENPAAREFYETEALRGGWSARQLDRQISTRFYERTALSQNKAAMLRSGARKQAADSITPEEAIKDPYILEFLGLKDEYSESDLEEGLIRRLEDFLVELGGDFAFIGRQKRLRIGTEWYRIDLLFFHRRLHCLVVIDLKVGKFTHADTGQMNLYVNYAQEHWTHPDENPPVGLILCAEKDAAVAKYSLQGLSSKILAAEYKLALPDEKLLVSEIKKARRRLEAGRDALRSNSG
jgi:predicted nuclease of restriction endonuclease-like (RecB) superfamily